MAEGWGPPSETPEPKPLSAPSASSGWGPPADEAKPESGPMPGPIDSLVAGVKKSISDLGQSAEVASGKKPTDVPPDTNPAAAPFAWKDALEPSKGLSKVAYQTGESGPTVAGGVAGGLLGSLAGPIGTGVGGIAGAATGAALQTVGPAFAQELKKHPEDPDGAWDKAVQSTMVSGAASGASWAAFPLRFFKGPIKNLAFQAFGVQPGISATQKVAQNVITGDPATSGLGQTYAQGVIGTAVPAIGHLALRGKFGEPETTPEAPTPAESLAKANEYLQQSQDHINSSMAPGTPPDLARKLLNKADDLHQAANYELDRHAAPARAAAKQQQAEQLEQQAQAPGVPPVDAQELRNQAFELRRDADHDLFIHNIPPPLPERTGLLGRLKQSYINNIQPELGSEAALKADAVVAGYKSRKAQIEDSIIKHGTETYRYKWNNVPWDDQKKFISAYEQGYGVPQDLVAKFPWMEEAYKEYKRNSDMDYRNEVQMGSKAHYVEDYFPHRWKDTAAAQKVFTQENMLKSMGPKWFQKARDYDLVEFGEANGLELKEKNVQDMVTGRRLAGAEFINKMEMLHNLQAIGIATPLEGAPAHIINPKIVGSPFHWEPVTAPNSERWLIAPDAQSLWKNGVEAQGLWNNETGVGSSFRGWMKVKSAWVPIKLGLSLFHPVHVAHILGVNNISRGLRETFGSGQQGLYRRFVAMPEAMLQTIGDAVFAATPYAPFTGKKMMKAWTTPKELQTPRQAADVKLLNEAGISAQLSEQMRMKAEQGFKDALSKSQYLRAIPKGALLGYEKTLGAIFEKWIPSLKVAALKREAELLLRRRPDLVNDDVSRQVAMRALGKSIDNRFGEMFYGSLFWNRTLKDASIGSFLSLGWNLGFAREFGGGAFEPIVRRMMDAPNPSRKLIRDTTNKTTNMFIYAMTAATINGLMNKGLSGDDPSGLDYIFPRIGGLNPDGSPRRITNAFYTREVPMAEKNIEERQSVIGGLSQMLYHKMMFAPFIEMGQNKDYFGNQIMDENSPMYQQMWQLGKHLVGDQLNPMSIAGAKRALELSGKPHDTASVLKQLGDRDVYMPLLGFGPAPSYASKSALDNRIQFLFRKYVAPEAKSFDVAARSKERSEARTAYLGAMQRGDKDTQMEAAKKLASLGVATKQISKLQPGGSTEYMFSRLQGDDQKALLKRMTPEEFKQFYPKANKKMRQSDPQINELAQRYFNQPAKSGWGAPSP